MADPSDAQVPSTDGEEARGAGVCPMHHRHAAAAAAATGYGGPPRFQHAFVVV